MVSKLSKFSLNVFEYDKSRKGEDFYTKSKKLFGKFKLIEHDLRRAKVATNSNRARYKIELQREFTFSYGPISRKIQYEIE